MNSTTRSVEHAIQHLEDVVETLTRNLADGRKRLAETQAQIGASFEYAERLAELDEVIEPDHGSAGQRAYRCESRSALIADEGSATC